VRPLRLPPDLWLLFAPLKKARTALVVEKAVEMGVARIVPVQTEYTNAPRLREDRLLAHVVEAAEQCGATALPALSVPRTLNAALGDWPAGRRLMFCDEALAGQTRPPGAMPQSAAPGAVLIGPEGGFSPAERAFLHGLPFSFAVSLGPRILRADTAVVAALALWQIAFGDW
ncbi:MAG: 16S rRNA (uracil(1498)-N(3))-methyltransferase, partial [Paracoccaceae bacterium]